MERSGITSFVRVGLLAALLLTAGASAAQDSRLFNDGQIRGNDYTGAYFQLGAAVGQINFDGSNVDSDASGGFTFGGGYRFLPWLAADANFTFMGGGDVEVGNQNVGEGQFFAFTFGPKLYPFGLVQDKVLPDLLQPYALIGIGGGEFEIDDTSFDESAFISRLILGIDIWATDNFGFYVEGGGHVTSEDDVEGVGIFTFGGQFRF